MRDHAVGPIGPHRRATLAPDDSGQGIIEVIVALTVLSLTLVASGGCW